jgi:hypothetical protein
MPLCASVRDCFAPALNRLLPQLLGRLPPRSRTCNGRAGQAQQQRCADQHKLGHDWRADLCRESYSKFNFEEPAERRSDAR